jgi:lipopolysaccharide transport system ATP-binding protein
VSGRIAIQARGLRKDFRIYANPADRLLESIIRRPRHRVFTALDGIDLDVRAGETVGIVGRNGSGKSTLLQIIAGTLRPTQGSLQVHGRVAALLELGSGFNPEFSGRENVYLNAQVMGLRRHEVEARFERIVRFADIGDFIDQPVRTYSSGMLVRLAFAVAINTDPDILIIDEALAVGDEAFQRKCYARIEDIKGAGATVLFVSHSATSVLQLCDRAVLIDGGQRLLTGQPKAVIARYQRLLHAAPGDREALREEIRAFDEAGQDAAPGAEAPSAPDEAEAGAGEGDGSLGRPEIRPWPGQVEERLDPGLRSESLVEYQTRGARIHDPHVVNRDGQRVNVLVPGREYSLRFEVEMLADARRVEFSMTLKSLDGIALFGMSSHGQAGFLPALAAGQRVAVEFSFGSRLLPGTYFFNVGCQGEAEGEPDRDFLHRILDATCIRIDAGSSDRYKIGFYDLATEPASAWRILGP